MGAYILHSLSYLLLDPDWNVLVDEILHNFDLILFLVDIFMDSIEWSLDFSFLLLEVALLLLFYFQLIDFDS